MAIVVAWAVFIAHPYLNLDPMLVPTGNEFMGSVQTHHFWTRVQECGWCALWFGSAAGGSPAMGDFTAHMLNPLVLVTTLAWGVINGAKITMVGAFVIAALGQWWLGWELGVGRVVRVWGSCMAVVGGHLGLRVDHGPGFVLAIATCTLVFAALLRLARTGRRRDAGLVGAILGLAFLDGPTYPELGLLWTLPAALVLVPWQRLHLAHFVRRLALAAVIALLLAAPMLVPFLHFMPQIGKSVDPSFVGVQRLPFVPLNLVIGDMDFYQTDDLGKRPVPMYYANFVGAIPVALAIWGLVSSRGRRRRPAIYLGLAAFIAFCLASAVPQRLLFGIAASPQLQRLVSPGQFPPVYAALAVPPVLGLAALGVQGLLDLNWYSLPRRLKAAIPARPAPYLRWLILIPLLFALNEARAFNTVRIGLERIPAEVPDVVAALATPDLQWVRTPYGSRWYLEPAVGAGLKRNEEVEYRSWRWHERADPEPVLLATEGEPPAGWTRRDRVGNVGIYAAPPGHEYAAVSDASGAHTVCSASGGGGSLDVRCTLAEPGRLTVLENSWSGWHAALDGRPLDLQSGQWLAVDLPSGTQLVEFRYRPWDVPLGAALGVVGTVLLLHCLVRPERARPASHGAPTNRVAALPNGLSPAP